MGVIDSLVMQGVELAREHSVLVAAVLGVVIAYLMFVRKSEEGKLPPMVPYLIPWVGSARELGTDPINFLEKQRAKLGDAFTITMLGRKVVYLTGAKANEFFFNAREEDFSAQHAYASLTVPVFGEGVVYDVPNPVLVEQKKMIKGGLTTEIFQSYVPLMEEEVQQYFKRWGNEGEVDLLQAISEVTIMTASRCLLGDEIRSVLDEQVADLYKDLDGGFTPVNFLFPGLPLPQNRKRDLAHSKMRDIFIGVIRNRLSKNDMDHNDMLQTLLNASYKNGYKLGEREVAHLLIALLMAGQHTSSTTGTWMGHYIAGNKDLQTLLLDEQRQLCGADLEPLTYGTIKQFEQMDNLIKEVLRLHPPIFQVMRKVMTDTSFGEFTIPKGVYVAASPTVSQRQSDVFQEPLKFDMSRFGPERHEDTTTAGRYCYVPFGAGRHRCIGEPFAYVQLKAVWATLIRLFEFEAPHGFPGADYTSLVVMPERVRVRYRRRVPL